MASLHLSRTSDILNRCNLSFDSSKLRNIKENILLEISSKWETFNDSTATITEKVNDVPPTATPTALLTRKSTKIRSVYGQPEVILADPNSGLSSCHWRSLDSLDTFDSGHGLGSNSTSCSDLRVPTGTAENIKKQRADTAASDLGTSVESSDNEAELSPYAKRCSSSASNSSSSGCSEDDELAREAKVFMKTFVGKIFTNSAAISLEEKANFGLYARSESGRIWFGRYITKERNDHKCVSESTFYSLAQYFAIVLFECAEADHFTPAKSLMNMCFTYYHQPNSRQASWSAGGRPGQVTSLTPAKQYLCSVLRDQPIWRSLRFWNAAFFDAVQAERVTFFESRLTTGAGSSDHYDDWQFQANVTFGQLGTFTYQMHGFGLPKCLCIEFLRKQSTIANMTSEQINLLYENIELLYSCKGD